MATVLRRPVDHDARLSLTEHLDELRSRIIICVIGLVVAFGVTFWQSDEVLNIINRPLEHAQNIGGSKPSKDPLQQTARFEDKTSAAFRAQARFYAGQRDLNTLLAAKTRDPQTRAAYARAARLAGVSQQRLLDAAKAEPQNRGRQPITLGVTEPFTATISVALYAALLLALPLLLYQAYAFVLPAFAPGERKIALPLMLLAPFLFACGVAFAYFVVMPRAIGFLQNFNSDNFDILIQANQYYKFSVMFIGAIGLLFQLPLIVVAITRLGILTPRQLQANWGYVLLLLAIVAAVATPTPDPVTMMLALVPLFLLYEVSILLAVWLNRVSPPGHWWREADDDELAPAYDHED